MGTFRETESRWWGPGLGEREGALMLNADGVSAGEDGGALGVTLAQRRKRTQCHWVVCLEMVNRGNFMLCIFYHN